MQEDKIYINGKVIKADSAAIPAKDQGLLFGYGLFETLRVYNHIPFMLTEHLERLSSSSEILEIDIPSLITLETEISRFINHTDLCNGVLRITLTKGNNVPNIIFTHRSVNYSVSDYDKGFSLITSAIKRNAASPLAHLKTLNYMDNLLAKKEAQKAGFDEALLLNTDGLLSECSTSNIFFINDQTLYTPDINCGLLNGIVRQLLLHKIAPALHLNIAEGQYALSALYSASEIFITNSVMQIMPIVKVDHQIIGNGTPGSITKKIINAYNKYVFISAQF